MTNGELTRVHERIDAIDGEVKTEIKAMNSTLTAIQLTMTKWVTQCETCRLVVLGNGSPPIDKRVDRLEQVEDGRKRWFWSIVVGVPTVAAACITAIAHWLWR